MLYCMVKAVVFVIATGEQVTYVRNLGYEPTLEKFVAEVADIRTDAEIYLKSKATAVGHVTFVCDRKEVQKSDN